MTGRLPFVCRYEAIAAILETARARSTRTRPSDTSRDHAIHTAAEAGDVARVRALLDADPTLLNQGDREGATPLQRAIIGRARRVVRLLLDRGADIHAAGRFIHDQNRGAVPRWRPSFTSSTGFHRRLDQ